jgi:transglutaminase-like putative cysteine protease
MLTIHVNSEPFASRLRQLLEFSRRPRSVMQAAARGLRRTLVEHFATRDRTPNQLGGRRTHFWAEVAKSTQVTRVEPTQAEVGIGDRRFSLKFHGGRIVPKTTRFLTIPIHPEAHGKRAGEVEMASGMQLFVFRPRGRLVSFLARSTGDDTIRLLYVLKKSANVPADPAALPPREAMAAAALAAAEAQVRAEIKGLNLA